MLFYPIRKALSVVRFKIIEVIIISEWVKGKPFPEIKEEHKDYFDDVRLSMTLRNKVGLVLGDMVFSALYGYGFYVILAIVALLGWYLNIEDDSAGLLFLAFLVLYVIVRIVALTVAEKIDDYREKKYGRWEPNEEYIKELVCNTSLAKTVLENLDKNVMDKYLLSPFHPNNLLKK